MSGGEQPCSACDGLGYEMSEETDDIGVLRERVDCADCNATGELRDCSACGEPIAADEELCADCDEREEERSRAADLRWCREGV